MITLENPFFSVIIPAHNEEKYIKRCIDSIKSAEAFSNKKAEIIVVCNRCTDNTEAIAKSNNAIVVKNDVRCIAAVRNAGIKQASGDVIVTIDSDNQMTQGTLKEIDELLSSGKYIGGGAPIRFERYSFPLWLNDILCRFGFFITGLYCGIFWAKRETFDAIGGFVEKKAMEDIATAKLLKTFGKKQGKKYGHLKQNHLINSTRKYDDLGDWLYFKLAFKNLGAIIKAKLGDSSKYDKLIDEMFYDYN